MDGISSYRPPDIDVCSPVKIYTTGWRPTMTDRHRYYGARGDEERLFILPDGRNGKMIVEHHGRWWRFFITIKGVPIKRTKNDGEKTKKAAKHAATQELKRLIEREERKHDNH